jgi:hypothetical protein
MRCWYGLQRLDDLSCQRIFYRCRRSWRNSRLCRDHGGVVGEDGEGLAQQVQNLIPFLIPFPKWKDGKRQERQPRGTSTLPVKTGLKFPLSCSPNQSSCDLAKAIRKLSKLFILSYVCLFRSYSAAPGS